MADVNKSERKKLCWYSLRWQVVVILIVAWYLLLGRYWHSAGAGPAGPTVNATDFQQVWSTNQTVLLGLGDSITAGYGATKNHSYFDLLLRNDDMTCPDMRGRDLYHVLPNLKCINRSVSYTTSAEHLHDQLPRITSFPPQAKGIVVITTGGNDLIHDYGRSTPRDGAMYGCTAAETMEWKENFRTRLKAITDGVSGKFPGGCDIFLANIYDPTDGVGDIQHANLMLPAWGDGMVALAEMNKVIEDAARSNPHIHLVDLHALFLGHGIHCANLLNKYYRKEDPHYWYFQNLEDPNDRGYDAIRRAFLIEMSKVLKGIKD